MSEPIKKKKASAGNRKMQNVSFKDIDEFLEFLPGDELRIVELLRKIIFSCIPDCEEKLSYNVPFYKKYAGICFIWPSSVTWGGMKQKGVRLGFTRGYLMQDEINYLDKGSRKQVYWRDFFSAEEIDVELLRVYLLEAAFIDEEIRKQKKKK
jgi:hypothetical protein